MQVYIHRSLCDRELFALTSSPSPPKFAHERARWTLVRPAQLESLEGVDAVQAKADLEADGVHLCRGLKGKT